MPLSSTFAGERTLQLQAPCYSRREVTATTDQFRSGEKSAHLAPPNGHTAADFTPPAITPLTSSGSVFVYSWISFRPPLVFFSSSNKTRGNLNYYHDDDFLPKLHPSCLGRTALNHPWSRHFHLLPATKVLKFKSVLSWLLFAIS